MTLNSSAKLYLTIFLMTTCIYMVLYQYHFYREQIIPEASNELKVAQTNHNHKGLRQIKRHDSQQQPDKLSQVQQQQLMLQEKTENRNRLETPIDQNKVVIETSTSSSVKHLSLTSATPKQTELPPLYIITPTYKRPEQLAELTRLGYTLKHVSNLLWLVIEDAIKPSILVTRRLQQIGVPFLHLVAPMPKEFRQKNKQLPRGVSNRNRGLQWLRANATEGVFYFADDDNTYDIAIFEQMRWIKKVGMFPVGLITDLGVSSPIIRNGKMDGFYDGWIGGRRYPVDMAGFAVSVKFLLQRPNAKMPYKAGYEEDGFLKSLDPLNKTDIELLANSCTEILTWHTQTKKNHNAKKLNMTRYRDTNLVKLAEQLVTTL